MLNKIINYLNRKKFEVKRSEGENKKITLVQIEEGKNVELFKKWLLKNGFENKVEVVNGEKLIREQTLTSEYSISGKLRFKKEYKCKHCEKTHKIINRLAEKLEPKEEELLKQKEQIETRNKKIEDTLEVVDKGYEGTIEKLIEEHTENEGKLEDIKSRIEVFEKVKKFNNLEAIFEDEIKDLKYFYDSIDITKLIKVFSKLNDNDIFVKRGFFEKHNLDEYSNNLYNEIVERKV